MKITDLIIGLAIAGLPLSAAGRPSFGAPIIVRPVDPALPAGAPIRYPYDLATGDFDGDGKIDLVELLTDGGSGRQLRVVFGDGAGGGAAAVSAVAPGANLAVGDVDGDGHSDIIAFLNATAGRTVQAFLSDASRGFSVVTTTVPAGFFTDTRGLCVGDVDGDGNLDLAYSTSDTSPAAVGTVEVLLGDGAGGFQSGPSFWVTGAYGCAIADLDGDGRADIAVAGRVGVAWQNPDGSLGPLVAPTPSPPLTAATSTFRVALWDRDEDGDLDLEGGSSWIENRGSRSLQQHAPGFTDGLGDMFALGDLDGDGRRDLAFQTAPSLYELDVRSSRDGWSRREPYRIWGRHQEHERIADMDGDGDGDLLVSGELGLAWLPNRGDLNQAPLVSDLEVEAQPGVQTCVDAPVSDPDRNLVELEVQSSPHRGALYWLREAGYGALIVCFTPARDAHGAQRVVAVANDGQASSVPFTISFRVESSGGGGAADLGFLLGLIALLFARRRLV